MCLAGEWRSRISFGRTIKETALAGKRRCIISLGERERERGRETETGTGTDTDRETD